MAKPDPDVSVLIERFICAIREGAPTKEIHQAAGLLIDGVLAPVLRAQQEANLARDNALAELVMGLKSALEGSPPARGKPAAKRRVSQTQLSPQGNVIPLRPKRAGSDPS